MMPRRCWKNCGDALTELGITPVRRRLIKGRKKWLFGVASGLAEYFGLPLIVVRAAFVTATFFSILGLVAYFILVIWMPKPPSTDC